MQYSISIPKKMWWDARDFMLADRSREYYVAILCGMHQQGDTMRLLGRRVVKVPKEGYDSQSGGHISVAHEVTQFILKAAASEGLSVIDGHSHPQSKGAVGFSSTDDIHEGEMALYRSQKFPGTFLGSIVVNDHSAAARIWEVNGHGAVPVALPFTLEGEQPLVVQPQMNVGLDAYDRQVRAFGSEFQQRATVIKLGIVGVGGLGSVIAEQLVRLGVTNQVHIDQDRIDVTSLNRVLGSTPSDAHEHRFKVEVSRRTALQANPKARIRAIPYPLSTKTAHKALLDCNLIVLCTDNHESRREGNELCIRNLIPFIHAGVAIEVKDGKVDNAYGQVVIPELGSWCLVCSGVVNLQQASAETASESVKAKLEERGYIANTPAPAVYHLNALTASLAVTEIHNLISGYKPVQRFLLYREMQAELVKVHVPDSDGCMYCGLAGAGRPR